MGIMKTAAVAVFAGGIGIAAAGASMSDSASTQHWNALLSNSHANGLDVKTAGRGTLTEVPLFGHFRLSSHLFDGIGSEQMNCRYETSGLNVLGIPLYTVVKGGCGEKGQAFNDVEEELLSHNVLGLEI